MGLFRTLRRRVATRGGVDESESLVTGQERTSSDVEEGDPQRPLCVSPSRGSSSSAAGTPRSHEAYVSPSGDPAPPLPVTKSRSLDIHDKGHRRKLRFRRRGPKREEARDDDEEDDLGDIRKMTTFDGSEAFESRSERLVVPQQRSLVDERRDLGPIDLDELDSDSDSQAIKEKETRTDAPPSSPSSVSPDDEAVEVSKDESGVSKQTTATKTMAPMEDGGCSTTSTRTNTSQSSNSSFSSASSASSSSSSSLGSPSQHSTTRKALSMEPQFIPREQQRLRQGDEERDSPPLPPLSKPPLAPSRSSESMELALQRRRAASLMTRSRPAPLVGRDDDDDAEDERNDEEEKVQEEPQEDDDLDDDEDGAQPARAAVRTGRDHRRVSSDGSGQYLHIPLGDQLSTLYEEMHSEHEDSGDDADDEGRGGLRVRGAASRMEVGDSSSSQGSLSREDLFESEIGRYQVGRMTSPSVASTARSQGGTGRLIVAASAADDAVNIRQRWDYALRVMKRMGQCQPTDVAAAVLLADDDSTTSDEEDDVVRKAPKSVRSPRTRQTVEIGEI